MDSYVIEEWAFTKTLSKLGSYGVTRGHVPNIKTFLCSKR